MIIRHSETVVLDPAARDALRALLNSPAGDRILQALSAATPKIVKVGTSEDRLASAYSHDGYEEAIENLILFTQQETPPPSTESTNYPPLEDDSKWKDGHEGTTPAGADQA